MLTKDEVDDLRSDWKNLTETWKEDFDRLADITGIDFDKFFTQTTDPLKGAIKGMSEETASVLAGQFNAIRIHAAEQVNQTRISNGHLEALVRNTSYNRNLELLVDVRNLLEDIKKAQYLRL